MPTSHTVLALSFVGGCTILGAAIVFAVLMTRPPAPEPVPAPPVLTAPPSPPPAPPASVAASVHQRGHDNAARALARLHPHYLATCWQPAAALQPDPPSIALRFNLGFTPDGDLAAWGITEDRAINRPDVARCVREVPLSDLRIPAPGVPLAVEVTVTLP